MKLIRGAKPTVEDTTDSRFSVGISATPEINGILTSSPIGTEGVAPRVGTNLGINIGFNISKILSIRTGAYYGWKLYTHIHDGLVFPQDLQGPSPTTSRMESHIKYSVFHLPLIIQFNPFGKRFFGSAGLAWDYQHLATADRTVFYGNGDTGTLDPAKDPAPNFSMQASLGYSLKASDKFDLVFEPIFKFYFSDYIVTGSNLYNIGLRTTLNFNF